MTATTPAKPCACTGVRWCAACRDPELRAARGLRERVDVPGFLECRDVQAGLRPDGSCVHVFDPGTQSVPGHPAFEGLVIWPDFVDAGEAASIIVDAEAHPFKPAQSGKSKQHHGPRMNFRQQRMNASGFEGLPGWARMLEGRVRERAAASDLPRGLGSALEHYITTDAFVLRYESEQASNLDLHIDDLHAYGELILGLSLESDSWMTFVDADPQSGIDRTFTCVRAALPARSMVLLFGAARRDWFHGIRALDIEGRRTSITLRTLGSALRSTDEGREVMARAQRILPPGGRVAGPQRSHSPGAR